MSKFEYQWESEGYKCPYCGCMPTCDDWGFDYGGEVEDCQDCGKKYYATAHHTIDFESTPCCELNGDEHKPILNKKIGAYFCEICGECTKSSSQVEKETK